MERVLQKEIINYVKRGAAIDITNYSTEQITELRKNCNLTQLSVSVGIYGKNAALFRDENTGRLYAIRSRSHALQVMSY